MAAIQLRPMLRCDLWLASRETTSLGDTFRRLMLAPTAKPEHF